MFKIFSSQLSKMQNHLSLNNWRQLQKLEQEQDNDDIPSFHHLFYRWKFFRFYEISAQRYFEPLVADMYGLSSSTVSAFREINATSITSDYGKSLRFEIRALIDKYEFLLSETNQSVSEVKERDLMMRSMSHPKQGRIHGFLSRVRLGRGHI